MPLCQIAGGQVVVPGGGVYRNNRQPDAVPRFGVARSQVLTAVEQTSLDNDEIRGMGVERSSMMVWTIKNKRHAPFFFGWVLKRERLMALRIDRHASPAARESSTSPPKQRYEGERGGDRREREG